MKNLTFLSLFFIAWGSLSFAQNAGDYQKFYEKGKEEVAEENYQAALVSFDQAIQKMPYYSMLYYERGNTQMHLKNYESAVKDFSAAIQKKPYHTNSYLQRGIAYYHLSEYALAEADFAKILDSNSSHAEASMYQQKTQAELSQIALRQHTQENSELVLERQRQIKEERYRKEMRRRRRNNIIWGTVIPLAVWTTILIW